MSTKSLTPLIIVILIGVLLTYCQSTPDPNTDPCDNSSSSCGTNAKFTDE